MNIFFFNFFFTDPLEQFDLFYFFSIKILNIYISNFIFTVILHCILLGIIFYFYNIVFFNSSSFYFQLIVNFISSTLKKNLYMKRYPHFFYMFLIFFFIFLSNILGMVVYSFTITSSLILTFFFSSSFFLGSNIYGFLLNWSNFFSLFIPRGVPVVILPMLFIIEIISYFSRVISLAVRLFANMLSGHALLKILLSFVWVILDVHHYGTVFIFLAPWIITLLVSFLECAIAFLQAYVYLVLIIIYLQDVINLH